MAEHKLIDIDLLERYDGKIKELIVDDIDSYVNKTETYAYAPVVTIPDAVPANLADCKVKIEPIQDLHGQSAPWVGGAGDNKLDVSGVEAFPVDSDGYVSAANTGSDPRVWSYDNSQYKLSLKSGDWKVVVEVKTGSTGFSNEFRILNTSDVAIMEAFNAFSAIGTRSYNFTLSEDTNIGILAKLYDGVSRIMILPQSVTSNDWQPYTNICPISGHTEASVQRDGVNQFDVSTITTGKGIVEDSSIVDSSISCVSDYIRVMPNTNYYLTARDDSGSRRIGFYDQYKNNLQASSAATGSRAFTTPANCAYCRISVNPSYADETQLELGSTATPYVPYAGKTYTIALGDTIYGGTVDFDSGVMTVDRGIITLNGTESWSKTSNDRVYTNSVLKNDIKDTTIPITDWLKGTRDILTDDVNGIYINDAKYIVCRLSGVTSSSEDWKTFLASNNLTVCYELATPFTIQLTAQQIQLLQGQNTLYASTGEISLTVNGVSGAIGSIQAQTNVLSSRVPAPPTSGADEKYLRGDGVWTQVELPMEYMRTGTGSYDCTYRYFRYGRMISLWIENITCSSSDVGQELEICTLDDPRAPWPVGVTPIYGIGRYDGTQPVTASNIAYFYMDGDVVKAYAEKEFFYGNAYIVFTDSYSA